MTTVLLDVLDEALTGHHGELIVDEVKDIFFLLDVIIEGSRAETGDASQISPPFFSTARSWSWIFMDAKPTEFFAGQPD